MIRRAGQRSLRWQLIGGALVAAALSAVAAFAAAELMLIDGMDRDVLLAIIGAALVAGVGLALLLSRSLVRDVERLAETAETVGRGDLSARSGVDRPDEVGATARAFDQMAARLEAASAQAEAQAEERRLLFASISHDLRTPLAAMRAALEAIDDGVGDRDRLLAAARNDVVAMSALIDDLFLLAQLDAGRYEVETSMVDLAELVDEAAEALLPTAAAAGVDLRVIAHGPHRVRGSARELSRVVRNLLDNAIRHAPAGSAVAASIDVDGSGEVSLTVIDQGAGFPAELVSSAHEAFVRGDAARGRDTGGAGLGLAIVAGLVDAHDGTLTISPGPGGRVEVTLPTA